MVHVEKASEFQLKYKGIYDLDGFYRDMASFFHDRKYILQESLYKHKIPEIQFGWEAWRDDSEFKRSKIRIDMWSWNTKEVQVKVGGKERTMYSGRIRMYITSELNYDYRNRFNESNIKKLMLKFLMRVVFFYRTLGEWDDLYYETNDLKNKLKASLNMVAQGGGWND